MNKDEKIVENGKTIWVPKDQEPQPVPKNSPQKKNNPYQPKRTGKRYGERKNWW